MAFSHTFCLPVKWQGEQFFIRIGCTCVAKSIVSFNTVVFATTTEEGFLILLPSHPKRVRKQKKTSSFIAIFLSLKVTSGKPNPITAQHNYYYLNYSTKTF